MTLCGFLTLSALSAVAHTPLDQDGKAVTWYPHDCCHDQDCKPVTAVRLTPDGLWMTLPDGTGVLIGLDEPRRPSRDMRWHICLAPGPHRDVTVQCVFEPPSM
jgi:hypothetical protein